MKTVTHIRKMVVLVSVLFSLALKAQETIQPSLGTDYKNAIGLRIGETSGFTYKHFFNNGNAFEGIVSAFPHIVGLTGLYEKHFKTGAPGLVWYVGGGGHFNVGGPTTRVYYGYNGDVRYRYVYRSGAFAVGIDAIGGMEYKFKKIPLGISADTKPLLEVNDIGNTYFTIDPSIGVKFTF